MKDFRKIPWFGVALIIFGIAILVQKLHIVELDFANVFWPVMMLLAVINVGRGFSQERRGRIFGGTVWFLYSLFFFLRSADFIDMRPHMFVPATFITLGIGFLMIYVNNFRDWFAVIPAIILGGTGAVFLLADYGYLYYWDVWYAIRLYWPIVLIALGVIVMLRRRPHPPPAEPPKA